MDPNALTSGVRILQIRTRTETTTNETENIFLFFIKIDVR